MTPIAGEITRTLIARAHKYFEDEERRTKLRMIYPLSEAREFRPLRAFRRVRGPLTRLMKEALEPWLELGDRRPWK